MTNPTTDQAQAAARANIRGYAALMRSLLDGGEPEPVACLLMEQVLADMGATAEQARAMLVVALLELAAPPVDLSHLEA